MSKTPADQKKIILSIRRDIYDRLKEKAFDATLPTASYIKMLIAAAVNQDVIPNVEKQAHEKAAKFNSFIMG